MDHECRNILPRPHYFSLCVLCVDFGDSIFTAADPSASESTHGAKAPRGTFHTSQNKNFLNIADAPISKLCHIHDICGYNRNSNAGTDGCRIWDILIDLTFYLPIIRRPLIKDSPKFTYNVQRISIVALRNFIYALLWAVFLVPYYPAKFYT